MIRSIIKKKRFWVITVVLVLIITYLSGPVPQNPGYPARFPALPKDLKKLEKHIQEQESAIPLRQDNKAHITWNNSTRKKTEYSFVYLHGFTGSYRDAYPLNVNLAKAFGANIYLSRWAGHGMKPEHAMQDFSAENAWISAKEALAIGHRIGNKVIILSTSTGGTLGLMLAAAFPDSVYALINISPNIRDDQPGAFVLNTPWGMEIAHMAAFGDSMKIKHNKEVAYRYWDSRYPAEALVELQVLVGTTMKPELFKKVTCPVLTLYYHKNFWNEDEHVEISKYPKVHKQLGTPDSLKKLIALKDPGTHFIGSNIKSKDYVTAQEDAIDFCIKKLGMEIADSSYYKNSGSVNQFK